MPGLLSGRVALITGGGGEIGGAIARRFAAEGAAVAVADIRRDAGGCGRQGDRGRRRRVRLPSRPMSRWPDEAERSVRHAVEAFGALTTLVNVAAAVTPDGTVETLTLDAME